MSRFFPGNEVRLPSGRLATLVRTAIPDWPSGVPPPRVAPPLWVVRYDGESVTSPLRYFEDELEHHRRTP